MTKSPATVEYGQPISEYHPDPERFEQAWFFFEVTEPGERNKLVEVNEDGSFEIELAVYRELDCYRTNISTLTEIVRIANEYMVGRAQYVSTHPQG